MSINSFLNQTISFKLIIIIGGFWLIVASLIIYYFFGGVQEGFDAVIVGVGSALDYKMGDGVKRSWENKDTSENNKPSVVNDNTNIYSALEKNDADPVPLSEGELLIFANNKFSPECCPSSYSNANGCVCASPEQMKHINERGGNRTLSGNY
jgi:hypothetical protein